MVKYFLFKSEMIYFLPDFSRRFGETTVFCYFISPSEIFNVK